MTLTKAGRDLLDSHTLDRDDAPQAFHEGVSRPREIDHDSNLYATYRQEESRLRDERGGLDIGRVILEQDLKREYQEFLQEHHRNRSDSDGRPDRDEGEICDWAPEHDLPYFDGQVHFPYYRIEYEIDGRERHEDVELLTPHCRGAHAVSRAKTGFRIYVVGSHRGGGRPSYWFRGRRSLPDDPLCTSRGTTVPARSPSSVSRAPPSRRRTCPHRPTHSLPAS